nr:MAG TPA: hypothetical protein [Caudoviricetes sp.]
MPVRYWGLQPVLCVFAISTIYTGGHDCLQALKYEPPILLNN